MQHSSTTHNATQGQETITGGSISEVVPLCKINTKIKNSSQFWLFYRVNIGGDRVRQMIAIVQTWCTNIDIQVDKITHKITTLIGQMISISALTSLDHLREYRPL